MKKYIVEIDDDGDVFWHNEAEEYHREEGPAVERINGTREWWLNGKRHREDGPALEFAIGTREWWVNGKRFRTEEEYNNRNKKKYKVTIFEVYTLTMEVDADNANDARGMAAQRLEDGPIPELFYSYTKEMDDWVVEGL